MQYALIAWLNVLKYMYIVYNEIWKIDKYQLILFSQYAQKLSYTVLPINKPWLRTEEFSKEKNVSIKFIHDLEHSFSDKIW